MKSYNNETVGIKIKKMLRKKRTKCLGRRKKNKEK